MTEHPDEGSGAPDPFAPPTGVPLAPAWGAPSPPPGGAPASPWGAPYPPAWAQPYATPYAWGPAGHQEPRPTNPWAVVALVTGILALLPVAWGAGIAALVQIRRRGQSGTGLAIAGIVVSSGWAVIGLLAAAVAVFGTSGSGGDLGRVADAGSTSVSDCLRQPDGDGSVATQVDCATSHDAEVFLVQGLGETGWPGYDTIDGRADDVCYAGFDSYVGTSYDDSSYDYGYFLPDQGEWESGEHRVVCVVLQGDADTLRGSVRGSGG